MKSHLSFMDETQRYCTTLKRSTVSLKLLAISLIIFSISTVSAYDDLKLWNFDCPAASNLYTKGSPYETNLKNTLSTILSDSNKTSNKLFYNFSSGQDPDKANAIGLCVGYVKPNLCYQCLNHTINQLQAVNCTMKKEAIGWEDWCMVRYANRPIFSLLETAPWHNMTNPNILLDADVTLFNDKRDKLLSKLQLEATTGNPPSYYKDGNDEVRTEVKVYTLVQCTPDLSATDCSDCLDSAFANINRSLPTNTRGGRIQMPSCITRFEADPFYIAYLDPTKTPPPVAPSSPPPPPPPPPPPQGKTWWKIVLIVVSAIVVASAIITLCLWRRKKSPKQTSDKDEIIEPLESLQFDFRTLEVATDDFSDVNKLGQGGFGVVYKGILTSGQEIAVKRLSQNSNQGQIEFQNEVMLLAKLQHRNLVRLLGFCLHGQEKLLVYEFFSNGSLDHYIFDPRNSATLDYETRYKIIGGIARGLVYLHEDSRLTIIHRDLKSGNVLLDKDMNPKISDFGLARLFHADQVFAQTNNVMGTFGYMAPEYVIHGKISVKADVYSFGVLLLEAITGKKSTISNTNEDDLISYVWKNWRQGRAADIVQRIERADAPKTEMIKCIHIGLLCVQENVADRPTMSAVLHMLNSNSITLHLPPPPSFVSRTNFSTVDYSSSQPTTNSANWDEPKNEYRKSLNEASIVEIDI